MRKSNLNKSKNGSAKGAGRRRGKRLTPSTRADNGRGTRSDASASQPISGKNSKRAKVLDGSPGTDALFEHGVQLRLCGRFQDATRFLKAALRRFPDQAPVLWYLGGIFLHDLHQPQAAVPFYRKAARLSPRSQRASLGLFHSLWHLGRHREALKELNRFQSIAPCDDYVEILAEIRKKSPELLTKSPRTKAS